MRDVSLHLKLLLSLIAIVAVLLGLGVYWAGPDSRRRRLLFRAIVVAPAIAVAAEGAYALKDWKAAQSTAALRVSSEDDTNAMFYRSNTCNYRFSPSRQYRLWGGTVSIDRNGFRSTYDVTTEKPANTTRIILTGGSSAFGFGVPDGHDIAAHMTSMLNEDSDTPRCEVINAAVSYYTSFQEVNSYLHILSQFDPDVLIVLDGRNDLWIAVDYGDKWRPVSEECVGHLPFWEPKRATFEALMMKSAVYRRVYHRVDRLLNGSAPVRKAFVDSRFVEQFVSHREMIAAHAKRQGTLCVLALQPVIHLGKTLTEKEQQLQHMFLGYGNEFRAYWPKLQRATTDSAVPGTASLDLTDLFVDLAEDAYVDECHYSSSGNQMIAKALTATILNRLKQTSDQQVLQDLISASTSVLRPSRNAQ